MNDFLKKTIELKPELKHTRIDPVALCERTDGGLVPVSDYRAVTLNGGDSVLVDFGEILVGYIGFSIRSGGIIADAPTTLRFIPGEYACEVTTPQSEYVGALSSGWLQREDKTAVFLPYAGRLDRRFSFRYLKIERLDSGEFPVVIEELYGDRVSAASLDDVKPVALDPRMKAIDEMCVKTLLGCEQEVIEDGPKRDRRLWCSEFRLSALADSEIFRNRDLIRRCMYLFAAHPIGGRIIPPCVFEDSPPYVDDWYYVDLSLMFTAALADYTAFYGDGEFLRDLYPIAMEQLDVADEWFRSGKHANNCFFIDWGTGLDKTASAAGVYVYVLRRALTLAERTGDRRAAEKIGKRIAEYGEKVLSYYDGERGLFVAESGQLSWASQVWGVLSGVFGREENRALLERAAGSSGLIAMQTPHMHAYLLEALHEAGMDDRLYEAIDRIWGRMLDMGETLCPEYMPWDDTTSPYKTPVMNSACHGSGAAAAYWIRKYLSAKPEENGHGA